MLSCVPILIVCGDEAIRLESEELILMVVSVTVIYGRATSEILSVRTYVAILKQLLGLKVTTGGVTKLTTPEPRA